jgi:hypothetical protein
MEGMSERAPPGQAIQVAQSEVVGTAGGGNSRPGRRRWFPKDKGPTTRCSESRPGLRTLLQVRLNGQSSVTLGV